ncbi:putative cytochrome P450 [Stachybotrys elegans]|uniref:Cytochrome P450 n=1 Tax=Stachybotrys elegans TaxID=80388 RepID=A0A8K0WTV6_9HYPO|nr:putative cytochrome P450 [Stachybotrys elegans]
MEATTQNRSNVAMVIENAAPWLDMIGQRTSRYEALSAAVALGFSVWLALFLYRLSSHPLAKFPGPRLATFSNLPYSLSFLGGRQPFDVLKLHARYGSVVRVAPNELSFDTSQSWKDIYGTKKDHETFIKSAFYDGGNFADQGIHSIVSERDPGRHGEMRKELSSAFSDRSLREQEHLVSESIDLFVSQVGRYGKEAGGVNLTKWFNLMTFDVIGELAFGVSFEGLKTAETHSWVQTVLASMGQASLADTLYRNPFLAKLFLLVNPGWMTKMREGSIKHEQRTMDLVERRLNDASDRKDFMSFLLAGKETNEIMDSKSKVQLAAHASDFVIAGSETTATALAVVSYYLCKDRRLLKKLQDEVRSSFKSYDEINGNSTASLTYVKAVCLEALRIFPPLPLGLPRVVPVQGGSVDGHQIPGGTIVSVNPLAASLNSANFADPLKFDPSRWLEENTGGIGEDRLEASQPFSFGPRNCLGRALAWLEMRTTLAKLHYRYDMELVNTEVDWLRDSQMHLLWKKPDLFVRITRDRLAEM